MKRFYLILKILLILAILIAVSYLATTPNSEVILKRPWLREAGNTDYGVSEKVPSGEIWEVYRGERKVLWLQNQPGFLISTALLPPGIEPIKHPFANAKALDPTEEDNLQKLLSQSKSFEEYLFLLKENGYTLNVLGTPINISGGTQGSYGEDLRIGMESNPRRGQYVVDGVQETGIVTELWFYVRGKSEADKIMTVYIGQNFKIDRYLITVEDIKSGSPGLVSLRIISTDSPKE